MALRVEVDRDSCQSSGHCVREAPEGFRLDADHLVELIDGGAALTDAARLTAARHCPALAIRLFDADGQEVDPD